MSDRARGVPCNYKYKRSSLNSILGSLVNGQLKRQKFRTSSSSRKGKYLLGFLKLQMIKTVHGGLPYSLSFAFYYYYYYLIKHPNVSLLNNNKKQDLMFQRRQGREAAGLCGLSLPGPRASSVLATLVAGRPA